MFKLCVCIQSWIGNCVLFFFYFWNVKRIFLCSFFYKNKSTWIVYWLQKLFSKSNLFNNDLNAKILKFLEESMIIRTFESRKKEIDSTAVINFLNYLKEKNLLFFPSLQFYTRREENKHVSWNGKRQTPKSWPRLHIWIELWIATRKTMMWVCRWEKSILVKRSIDEMGAQMFRWMAGCPGGKCGTRLRGPSKMH